MDGEEGGSQAAAWAWVTEVSPETWRQNPKIDNLKCMTKLIYKRKKSPCTRRQLHPSRLSTLLLIVTNLAALYYG